MKTDELSTLLGFDISEQTMDRLRAFVELVKKWNPRINLVSRTTLDDIWMRHIVDSAQLFALAPTETRLWGDIGSGGGFPGVVLAILSGQEHPDSRHFLVESDLRKASFLMEAMRVCGCNGAVYSDRAEKIRPLKAQVMTARALAPLPDLIPMVQRHLGPSGCAILPKGASFDTEIAQARQTWDFNLEVNVSRTDPSARVLSLSGLVLKH